MDKNYKYMLICSSCNNKHFTNGHDVGDLFFEVKTAPPPKHADGVNKETQDMPRKFRCPQCGYIFKIVKLKQETPEDIEDPHYKANVDLPSDKDKDLIEFEKEMIKSISVCPIR